MRHGAPLNANSTITTMQIADKYTPGQLESKWYQYWIDQKLFHSEIDHREPYTIVIPPPN